MTDDDEVRRHSVTRDDVVATAVPMLGGGGGETPAPITIPLAEIPDGFDIDQIRKAANLFCTNALGIPVQDIEPVPRRRGGQL